MSYSSEVLADSPLVYYRLGEASGSTLVDSSGNGRNGTYNGDYTLGQPGLTLDTDTAAAFAGGATAWTTTTYGAWMNSLTTFTVEVWFRLSDIAGGYVAGRWPNSGGSQWFIVAGGDDNLTTVARIGGTQRNLASTYTRDTTTIYHVAMTYDGTTLRQYVNGVETASGAWSGSMTTSTGVLHLGRIASATNSFLPGTLDEFAMYGSALSAARILAHYTAGTDATVTGTLAATGPAGVSAGTGAVTIPAALVATGPAGTASLAGTVTTTGTIAATGPAGIADGSATVDNSVAGALTATGPAGVAALAGTVTTTGTLAATGPAGVAAGEADTTGGAVTGTLNATGPAGVASAQGNNDVVDGWVADLTGRALIGVTTTTVDLYVPGDIATPPGAVTVRQVVRNSHQMPALTALTPRYAPGEYTVLDTDTLGEDAIVGTWHVWVDGIDRTYDADGELLDIDDLVAEKGLGDRSARVDVKRIQIWHTSGTGDYSWLYPGAKVEAGIVHPDGSRTILFAGDLISDDTESTTTTFSNTWTVQGTLVQAVQAVMQPLDEMEPTQVGTVVPRVLNGIISRRFPKIPTLATPDVETRKLGSYGQKVGDYVKAQLALAWDGDSQLALGALGVNRRQYAPVWTDTTTVHWTLTAAAPGISARLGEDWSQVVNCYFGRGTLPSGHRWMNRRFPYMLPYAPPTYFSGDTSAQLVLGSTDAETINNGVSLLNQRLREIGYHDVPLSDTFGLQTLYAVRRLQTTRGLLVDGHVGGQTWTSIWSIGATGADLRSMRLPLWSDPRVEPWFYLPNGAIAEPNPAYDPQWPRIEEDIDYGDNTTLALGVADATARGERTKEPGIVGTITAATDFWEGSRFLADPAQNLTLLGWKGQDPLLHIVQRTIRRKAGTVDLVVDSKFRDALTIRQIMERDAESKADPARRPGAIGRTSSTTAQDFTLFDGDSPAGIVPELTLRAGLWSVWPFPLDRVGTLARSWARTYDPVTRFVMLLFGREVLPSQLHANLGNALTSTRQWSDPGIDAWLTRMGFITGWGQEGQACGFYPGAEDAGNPVTGAFLSTQPANFTSQVKGFAWVAIQPEHDTRFEAEFEPQAKG